jgi:hypothetical protein
MQRIKYPRTFHLPWSGSESSDDVWWKDCAAFEGQEVVITEKLDGECTTIYKDGHCHARAVDSTHHPSRSWIKALAGGIAHRLPYGYRVCGENLFAWHSILYTELSNYFFVFGIYDDDNCLLSWRVTEELCGDLGLHTVPVLWRGVWNEEYVRDSLWKGEGHFPTFASKVDSDHLPAYPEDFESCEAEGYVVRRARSFMYDDFQTCCAKYVRPKHVTTDSNWMTRQVVKNLLKTH